MRKLWPHIYSLGLAAAILAPACSALAIPIIDDIYYVFSGTAPMLNRAASNVVRVTTFGPDNGQGNSDPALDLHFSSQQEGFKDAEAFRSAKKPFWAEQTEFCARHNQMHCPLYDEPWMGSAFFVRSKNGPLLVTNYHVLYGTINNGAMQIPDGTDAKHLLPLLRKQNLFFVLQNRDGEAVFDARSKNAAPARLVVLNDDMTYLKADPQNVFKTDLNAMMSDVAIVKIKGQVPAHTLKIARQRIKTGEPIFTVGYPQGQFKVFQGQVIDPTSLDRDLGIVADAESKKLRGQFMIFSDISCDEGSSGSPFLNAKGEVVGVFSGIMDIQISSISIKRICYGVDIHDIKALRQHWSDMKKQDLDDNSNENDSDDSTKQ